MHSYPLIVLSYHRFTEEPDAYPFSRTYSQFALDLVKRDFDWVTIDDGHQSIVKACAMMQEKNMRAKLFVSTALVGTPGYCTWDELWKLSRFHDVENHSHDHVKLTELGISEMTMQLRIATWEIKKNIGRSPRYFIPPWNQWNEDLERVVRAAELIGVRDRIEMKKDS